MIQLQNINDPERFARFYVMLRNADGVPQYLSAGGWGWYTNPGEALCHYNISAAKAARTRFRNKELRYAENRPTEWLNDIEIVRIVIDSYHFEQIC